MTISLIRRRTDILSFAAAVAASAAITATPASAGGLVPATPPASIVSIESDDHHGGAAPPNPKVLFARTAAPWSGQPDGWWLRLDVTISNTSAGPLAVTGLTVDTDVDAPENVVLDPPVSVPARGRETIMVPSGRAGVAAQPTTLGVRATISGYAQQIQRVVELVEYESPTPSKGYVFPGRSQDLPGGVSWYAGSHAHNLTQRYAYDFGARRWDAGANQWRKESAASHQREAAGGAPAGSLNADHLIFDRPVYALAAATLVRCWRSLPDNVPGQSVAGGGNSVILDLGDGTFAAYHHLKQLSVPAAICPSEGPDGADDTPLSIPIGEGQLIGRVGNSGKSSGPHLHMQITDDPGPTAAAQRGLPLRFRGISVHTYPGYNPETDLTGWNVLFGLESAVPVNALIRPPCGGPGCFILPAA